MIRPGELSPGAATRLLARRPLVVDPTRGRALKRNVHELLVGAPADRFARALETVLIDPSATFAGLVLLRLPGRAGRPFEPGERFQAAVRLPARVPFARLFEERLLGDATEIEALERAGAGGTFVARYRYLEGAPLAGTTTLRIEPAGPARARLTTLFEIQEVGLLGVEILHRFGIRTHDRALLAQVSQAMTLLSAPLLASSMRN